MTTPRPTVLVAEDDARLRTALAVMLERRGCEVLEADTGVRALALAHESVPDGLLLDIMLPGVDGYEIVRALRAHERTREMLVVVLSGRAGAVDRNFALQLGADAYFLKTATAEAVRVLLARLPHVDRSLHSWGAMRPITDERALLALLKVDERSPWEEVRRAFRGAVRASHPDLHPGDTGAEQRLKELNAAWEAINTPGKWAAHVRRVRDGVPASGSGPRRGATAGSVGRLRVQRQQHGSVGRSNWWLELDGEVVTSIENGGVSVLDAGPGRHALRVFYGSCSSPTLQIELQRGQELTLGCRQLESLRVGLFSPQRSLVLEPLNSRRFAA